MNVRCTPNRANKFMFYFILYELFGVSIIFSIPFINVFLKGMSLPALLVVNQIITFLPPIIAYFVLTGERVDSVVQREKLGFINIVVIVLLTLISLPFIMIVSELSTIFFPNTVGEVAINLTNYNFWISIIAIAVTPAIFEELTFRGIVYSNYKNISIQKGAVLTGLFFGIMHLNGQQFMYAFLLGIMMTYLVYYTKSIYASAVSHFTVNATNVAIMYLSMNSNEYESTNIQQSGVEVVVQLIYYFTTIIWFVPLFYILFRLFVNFNKDRHITQHIDNNPETNRIVDFYFLGVIFIFSIYMLIEFFIYN